MSDVFVGQIKMVGFSFAPRNYLLCDGASVQIQQNTSLYALLGSQFGGDNVTYFNVPDMRTFMPMQAGVGPGLSQRWVGYPVGHTTVALNSLTAPDHSHSFVGRTPDDASSTSPQANAYGQLTSGFPAGRKVCKDTGSRNPTKDSMMSAAMVDNSGNSAPHENRQPYLAVNFIIAGDGVFPPRN